MVPKRSATSPVGSKKGISAFVATLVSLFALAFALGGCAAGPVAPDGAQIQQAASSQHQAHSDTIDTGASSQQALDEDGWYYSKDEVSGYIQEYGCLPSNYITKKEAKALGWSGGSVEKYAPGKAIGGDKFGNYEGLLPEVPGRTYTECDIDTNGAKSRGAKRIVFSSDGQIYYTEDHYESFELIAGEQ